MFFFFGMFQCMFAHSLRKFSMRDWGIEQKWMSILLPLLLLYNGELQYCILTLIFPSGKKPLWTTTVAPFTFRVEGLWFNVSAANVRWSGLLLIVFCCFCISDPFFPLSFLVNSWFPGTLDAFFQALFLCALLLFWLCVYHGIRVQVGPLLYLHFHGSLSLL